MLHCWQLLKDNEKWRTRNNEPVPKKLKSCNSSYTALEEEEDDDLDDEEGGSPTTNLRPPGRKQEKNRLKKQPEGAMYVEVIEKMMETKKELEAEKKIDKEEKWLELKAIEERKVAMEEERLRIKKGAEERLQKEQDQKIMFMDTSSLDPQQMAYIETLRSQILASVMNSRLNSDFSFNGGSGGSM